MMRGLYAIVDLSRLEAREIGPIPFVQALLLARPAAVQLRAKQATPRDALSLLRTLAPLCHAVSVPLVVNDRPDWALLAGCDMVHVGQSDIPIDRVRRLAPGVGIGVSTHTLEQLDLALLARPTYVAYGPVFATESKANPDPVVGPSGLREAFRRASSAGIPLVAIGGITAASARALVGIADAVAAIGELLPPSFASGGESPAIKCLGECLGEVTARARALSEMFGGGISRAGAA
jgi:thiamine-phosphate pyrophosphorylase